MSVRSWHEMVFTVERARAALPYVAIIVDELVDAYRSVQRCRRALEIEWRAPARRHLVVQRDAALTKFNDVMDECDAVGIDLLDLHDGVIAFRCDVDGRSMSLLWRLGEPIRSAWKEFAINAGQAATAHGWAATGNDDRADFS
jgi:hypothetical protein